MQHSFNTAIAEKSDVPSAILIEQLAVWIRLNQVNGNFQYDGYYWARINSKLYKLFSYWSQNQIKRIITRLEEAGTVMVIKIDTRNKDVAIIDPEILSIYGILSNPDDQPKKPETESTDKTDYSWYLAHINETVYSEKERQMGYGFRAYDRDKLKARLKIFTKEQIMQAIEKAVKDKYHIENNLKYLTPEYFTRNDNNIDKFLNQKQEETQKVTVKFTPPPKPEPSNEEKRKEFMRRFPGYVQGAFVYYKKLQKLPKSGYLICKKLEEHKFKSKDGKFLSEVVSGELKKEWMEEIAERVLNEEKERMGLVEFHKQLQDKDFQSQNEGETIRRCKEKALMYWFDQIEIFDRSKIYV